MTRVTTDVESLDPGSSEVTLRSGERIGFDRLLLTTGGEPRRLSVPGSDLDGILYLRTTSDSDAIEIEVSLTSEAYFYVGLTGDVGTGGVFVPTYQLRPVGSAVDVAIGPDLRVFAMAHTTEVEL